MLDSADALVRQLHALLAPAAALRVALRLLDARRAELGAAPVPLQTRAHVGLADGAAAADLARFEADGRLGELLAELSSIELAPDRCDAARYAALRRSVHDQLAGATPDPALEAAWVDCGGDSVPVTAGAQVDPAITIEVARAPRVQFAAWSNGVPVVAQVVVTNHGSAALDDLELRLQIGPDFGSPCRLALPRIEPGASHVVATPDVALDRARLGALVERVAAALHVELRAGPRILVRQRLPIDLLAWNEWARALPDEFLAAFVLPNEPKVAALLADARDVLAARTGDPALAGYQAAGCERIDAVASALGATLARRGITYHALPASFEKDGQKLRLPGTLLEHRMGNCIELALLLAAALEQAALHPVIVLVEGHALAGVWRVATQFETVAVDSVELVRKRVELGDLLLFDATTLVAGGEFAAAVAAAARRLGPEGGFEKLLDVKAARVAGIVPIVVPGRAPTEVAPSVVAATAASSTPRDAVAEAAEAVLPRPLADRLDRWRRQLLDLSLRNPLISWRESRRSVALDGGDLAAIEDRLVAGREFFFAPKAPLSETDPRADDLAAARGRDAVVAEARRDLFERGALLTRHEPEELERRLVTLFREDRLRQEETGSSTLFLALGFLRWYESPTSSVARLAPLLLVPVRLERKGLARRIALRQRDEEPRANESLLQKLRAEHSLDTEPLLELPVGETGVDVAAVLAQYRRLVADLPRCEVVAEAALGFFSFARHLLWRDLEEQRSALLSCELVRHLVQGAGDLPFPDPGFVDPRRLDEAMPPSRSRLVLDADSSQQVAIEAAVRGATFVLQGPPGTGKSQTIANLVAGCIAAGRRVLFVAEKRAALEVVAQRLARAGLGDACLELHSSKAAKAAVIAELQRTLEDHGATAPPDPLLVERTERAVAELNGYAAALHRRPDQGFSAFEAISRLVAQRAAPHGPPLPFPDPRALTRAEHARCREAARELADAVAATPLAGHPFVPVRRTDHSPLVARQVEQELVALQDRVAALHAAMAAAAQRLEVTAPRGRTAATLLQETLGLLAEPPPGRALEAAIRPDRGEVVARLRSLAALLEADRADRAALAPRWSDALFALDVAALHGEFERHAGDFAPLRWLRLRSARTRLRTALRGREPEATLALADLARARQVAERARTIAEAGAFLDSIAGAASAGGGTDPALLRRIAAWLAAWGERLAQWHSIGATAPAPRALGAPAGAAAAALGQAAAAFDAALDAVTRSLDLEPEFAAELRSGEDGLLAADAAARHWRERLPELKPWCRTQKALRVAGASHLAPLIDALRKGALQPSELGPAFERACFTAVAEHAISGEPALRDFDGARHHQRVAAFRGDDRELVRTGAARVLLDWRARRTVRAEAAFPGSEVETLQREARKKRRQMALRRLFAAIPTLLRQLKPCLLMSPNSIAQYLPVAQELFDVVVFDEASQIPTHDAIGALARGRKVVIVGDSRQLPPTAFFARAVAEDDAEGAGDPDGRAPVEELESILEEAVAAGVPALSLRWHYRSRDESLIAFSNRRYYGDRLHTFPSAAGRAEGLGVALVPVSGTFESGGRRVNEAEARAVVDWIVGALRDPERRRKSIGVVTFNQPQQALIEDLLDAAVRDDAALQAAVDGAERGEPLFVKNLENVQGDERDVLLFSTTFAKGRDGRLSLNFGPLNQKGGERRLNVAVTRAREKLLVFTSLAPEDIDLARTAAEGVRHLREYLDYARRGAAAFAGAPAADPAAAGGSELEEDVARELAARGHVVDRQVGCSGYRIDLAVRDPGRTGSHLLAIECDGAAYHSGATARDRDRLRQSVLEGLGWRILRIWSADWVERRAEEIARVESAIAAALAATTKAATVAETRIEGRAAPASEALPPESKAAPPAGAPELPVARPFPIEAIGTRASLEESLGLAAHELLVRIVAFEGPLHVDALLQRAARCFAIQRLTAGPEALLRSAVGQLAARGALTLRGEFAWPAGLDPASWDVVRASDVETGPRPADQIPPEERRNALRRVLRAAGGGAVEDVAAAAARLLGFRVVHTRTRAVFEAALTEFAAAGGCRLEAGRVAMRVE